MEPDKEFSLINEASIVDLKAELYKKEIEAQQKGIGTTAHVVEHRRSKTLQKIAIMTGKAQIKPKLQATESSAEITPAKTELDTLTEYEQRKLKDCEDSLKAKSKIYEKLQEDAKKGIIHGDLADSGVMVDFDRKISHSNQNISKKDPLSEKEASSNNLKSNVSTEANNLTFFEEVQLAEAEHREKMNLKWEEERERLKEKPLGQEHYQDVFFNELREHGVGYYQFSAKESERSAQLDLLKKLRDQTKVSRLKNQQIKEKREQAIKERMLKIRKRRGENIDESIESINASPPAEQLPPQVEIPPLITQSEINDPQISMNSQIESIITNSREESIMNELVKKTKLNTPQSYNDEPPNLKFAPPKDYSIKSRHNKYH